MSEAKIAGGYKRLLQKSVPHAGGWTKARRKTFLDALAASCNVKGAAAEVGMSTTGAYALRRRDPAFADLWREAMEIGYQRLEEALLQRALEGVNAIEIEVPERIPLVEGGAVDGSGGGGSGGGGGGDDAPPPAKNSPGAGTRSRDMRATSDVQLALLLLNRHRSVVEGRGSPSGWRGRATSEETDAALRKHLDALARRLKAKEE